MPDNPVVRFNLGRAYLAKQNRDAARVQFEEAVKLRPDYSQARVMLAEMLLQNRDFEKALQMTQAVLAYDQGNVAARLIQTQALAQKGELVRARQELKDTAEKYPGLAEPRLQTAALDLRERNYKAAEDSFKKLYGQSQDPRAFVGLIDSYVAQGDNASALKSL